MFLRADSVGLIPVNLSLANRTIGKPDAGVPQVRPSFGLTWDSATLDGKFGLSRTTVICVLSRIPPLTLFCAWKDEGELSSTKTSARQSPLPRKVFRPVTGPVRSRFSAHLPTQAAVQPQKPTPKSFVKRILPLSPTHSIFYPESTPQVLQNEDFATKRGEGGYPVRGARSNPGFRVLHSGGVAHPSPLTGGPGWDWNSGEASYALGALPLAARSRRRRPSDAACARAAPASSLASGFPCVRACAPASRSDGRRASHGCRTGCGTGSASPAPARR